MMPSLERKKTHYCHNTPSFELSLNRINGESPQTYYLTSLPEKRNFRHLVEALNPTQIENIKLLGERPRLVENKAYGRADR